MDIINLRKIIGKLHLWLGLFSGLVVFVLGITGCIWAFEEEIKAWVYADKLKVEVPTEGEPLALGRHLQSVQQALGANHPIQRITVENAPGKSIVFRSFSPVNEASGIWYWNEIQHNYWVYVNPYTAEILKKEDQTFEFFTFTFWLHWSLLLKTDIGQPIVGSATFIFIIMLVTGLVLWWPKNKAARIQRFRIRWKPTTRWKRKNYDLHNILGFYSMFLTVFIALTGLMWAFTWFSDGVQWLANGGESLEREQLRVTSIEASLRYPNPLDMVYETLQLDHPNAKTYYINLPMATKGTIGSYVDYKDNSKDIYLHFDQYSGERLHSSIKWEDKTNGEKIQAYNYDIHTGAIGGLLGKTVAFFVSLFSASLPITGFFIWYGRHFKKGKRRSKKQQRLKVKDVTRSWE
ncbi:MAG: PepSY-associated TM helix domain-containing protein [Bacteroidota bacterium]